MLRPSEKYHIHTPKSQNQSWSKWVLDSDKAKKTYVFEVTCSKKLGRQEFLFFYFLLSLFFFYTVSLKGLYKALYRLYLVMLPPVLGEGS